MSLSTGTRLGPYEIVAAIGAGGMGEVYRARDTRLDRTVAIKVLPAHVAADPDLRARFEREARAVAALQHPHICVLHDVGEAPNPEASIRANPANPANPPNPESPIPNPVLVQYLVMEYLDGETLADRLKKGPLPLDQALQYAIQIADALDKAHRQGITHRDLKPGNVMLTKSGTKLLDFGLARTGAGGAGGSGGAGRAGGMTALPTEAPLTGQGTLLGTLQYMAPEQLEGRDADARTDIFAFGAVVYEMVTGKKAFEGKSQASVIAAILERDPPPISALQPLTPPALDQLVKRCLAKDREERWQSALDVKLQLSWIAESASVTLTPVPVAGSFSRERVAWAVAGLSLVALIAALALAATWRPRVGPAAASQFVILPPEKADLGPSTTSQAISSDGRQLAFVASNSSGVRLLWIRPLDSLTARPLTGTDDATGPFWSPDSRSVAFFARGKLKRIETAGGPVQTLADASGPGGTWSRDGVIVFSPTIFGALSRVSARGGAVSSATSLDQPATNSHLWPFFLPDGRHFVFLARSTGNDSLYVGSLDSKEVKPVPGVSSAARYSPPGYLLFVRENTLMAQGLDATRLSTSGDPFPLVERVAGGTTADRFGAGFSVSENGTLVYREPFAQQTQLAWVDRTGKSIAVVAPAGIYTNPALSPDDTRVAFYQAQGGTTDVWLMDLSRHITSRFTFEPPMNNVPMWSPDGRLVVFASRRSGALDLYQRPSNGSGPDELLLKLSAAPIVFPSDWSADGRFLAYYRTDPKTQLALWVLPLFGDRQPFPFLRAEFNESQGQFSPDGRWMAYVSDESGKPQVYVQSFPTLTGKWQVSPDGGSQPKWRRDGKELLYVAADGKLMSVAVRTGAAFEAEAPHALFETMLSPGPNRQNYAVSADGERFLMNTPVGAASNRMTVVLNWTGLLKK